MPTKYIKKPANLPLNPIALEKAIVDLEFIADQLAAKGKIVLAQDFRAQAKALLKLYPAQ